MGSPELSRTVMESSGRLPRMPDSAELSWLRDGSGHRTEQAPKSKVAAIGIGADG
jgi:hypothetical protein